MGITGLLPYLKNSARKANISEFKGCTVAVDSYCWLHKGAFSCAEKLALGEETDQYVYYCLKFVNHLLSLGIKPVMVFDGCNLPSKRDTERQRRERRQTNRKKAAQLLREGKRAEARQCLQMSIDVTSAMALKLMQACRDKGVDCLVAPYEADAQLAYLSLIGVAQVIITEDSDLILFGCEKVMFKMDYGGEGMLIERSKLNLGFGLQADLYSFEKFRYMCIMSGCDYMPNLPGIGLGKATKVFKLTRNPDMETVLRKLPTTLKMGNLNVTQEYIDGFFRANNTFLYQLVFDPLRRKVVPLNPYPADVDPTKMSYAGPPLSDTRAFEIALGNICINSGEKIADFDPETFTPKNKKLADNLPHMKSIWNPKYRPMGKSAPTSQATDIAERPSTRHSTVTVSYQLPKPSVKTTPPKRVRQVDESAAKAEHEAMLKSYAAGVGSRDNKRRRVELKEEPEENASDTDDVVDTLASLASPESSFIEGDESAVEEGKENTPEKQASPKELASKGKSPLNKFAVKSKPNKELFNLNAKKTVTDVKSRFFTQSTPLQRTTFFNMLSDGDSSEQPSVSLPPETYDEEDMSTKDLSLSFGLDAVLQRTVVESKPENKSPYNSFRPKLSAFKSDFSKSPLNSSSAKARSQFKPVKGKQAKLHQFEFNSKSPKTKILPKTNFFEGECENIRKSEKRAPSLPPETYDEDDQMEGKDLFTSQEPVLPSLSSDCDMYSIDNDSFSLSQLTDTGSVGSQSVVSSQASSKTSQITPTPPRSAKSVGVKRSNSILSMFRRVQTTNREDTQPNVASTPPKKDAINTLDPSEISAQETAAESSQKSNSSTSAPKPLKLGPCRQFGLSKTPSNSKSNTSSASKDKNKQSKLTDSLSVYFFNKNEKKLRPSSTDTQ